jgi:transcriptional regulator with XRE-family HTH domain
MGHGKYPYWEQGRRLRWLRQAMEMNQAAFAKYVDWSDEGQAGVSNFESGRRQVPAHKALQIRKKMPDFDPLWLWEDDRSGMSLRLMKQIDAEAAKEPPQSARGKRQDV